MIGRRKKNAQILTALTVTHSDGSLNTDNNIMPPSPPPQKNNNRRETAGFCRYSDPRQKLWSGKTRTPFIVTSARGQFRCCCCCCCCVAIRHYTIVLAYGEQCEHVIVTAKWPTRETRKIDNNNIARIVVVIAVPRSTSR